MSFEFELAAADSFAAGADAEVPFSAGVLSEVVADEPLCGFDGELLFEQPATSGRQPSTAEMKRIRWIRFISPTAWSTSPPGLWKVPAV